MAEYLARDLTMLQEINPDTISLSPFVPREGTSFRHQLPCNLETFLRLTAILRVMFPKANIAASPLVNSIHVQGQVMAIYSGANVLRVPLFPPPVPGVTRRSGGVSLLRRLQSLYASLSSHNYEMVVNRGDSLRFLERHPKAPAQKTNWTSFQWSQPVFDCSKTGSFYKTDVFYRSRYLSSSQRLFSLSK